MQQMLRIGHSARATWNRTGTQNNCSKRFAKGMSRARKREVRVREDPDLHARVPESFGLRFYDVGGVKLQ